ncbi:hypothetical protein EGH25_06145 [Haladaptatus sp. F3-133]|uniref:Uncharacterized protein n=1 Tax=Halorutilus salinus TaxID=2487751 RepID=A0A9Q4GG99_9EURY|nr:hypothetical protein [Halorutilus salinus]MCX2818929.1 hypothetical protein [Halorutilus salinus]
MSGCVSNGSNTTPGDDETDINQTDTGNRTDTPLNKSEYGGEVAEGTRVLNEEINVDTPYGNDYPPEAVRIISTAEEEVTATVRLLEGEDVIYSATLVQEPSTGGYRYPELIGKTGGLVAEVERNGEVQELECKTGPGFTIIAIDVDDVDGCTAPRHANIAIYHVTEKPDDVELVSSEELSEYDTVDSFVESYRYCDDNPDEKEACVTEDGEVDFFRGGVSGRRYAEFDRIIEKFPSYRSDDDEYPTGAYIEHEGEIYVFHMTMEF